jgi:uncharacterized membrane protein YbaN (DUF454 family)
MIPPKQQKKPFIHKKKSFMEIKNEWEKNQTLDVKNRFKAISRICFDISVSYEKTETSVEQLEFYIKIIKKALRGG